MKIKFDFKGTAFAKADSCLFGSFLENKKLDLGSLGDKELINEVQGSLTYKGFKAEKNSILSLELSQIIQVFCLGDQDKWNLSEVRKTASYIFKYLSKSDLKKIAIELDSFLLKGSEEASLKAFLEGLLLSNYQYDKYKKEKKSASTLNITLCISSKKLKTKASKILRNTQGVVSSVHITRDFVNEAPNILHSEAYAKLIQEDAKKNLPGVKVKVLNKAQIKKEKMNLFLSVNHGSAKEPRLVHLTYTPAKKAKKHYALVGKGITFDTGGYSLKPGNAMVSMKFDMGGSATLYGAFRSAVLSGSPYKISCILPMTDNAVNSLATTPDSVVVGRNGKSVEILNTDAEGRLILADALDYACDLKPDAILDAATLTGACLVALGTEVCAILGNNQELINNLLTSAKDEDEYLWQLPIIDEWRKDMTKSPIADLRNIGTTRFAGTATAAAFLENFIKNDIPWAHFDIAGVCDSQAHLPYCPDKGGSGVMVRTICDFLTK